jgi:NAD(P)-dependent dehydrogenase (short-subunit alcohol dehydrogenase family)
MKQREAIRERFKGKVAIVTGGSAGIGRATVEELCKEGSAVAFTGIEEDPGREVANKTAANLPVDGGYLGMGSEGLGKSSEFAEYK